SGSNRTLLHAAAERLLGRPARLRARRSTSPALAGALAIARNWLTRRAQTDPVPPTSHVLMISDGVGAAQGGAALHREVPGLRALGVHLVAVASGAVAAGTLDSLGAAARATGTLAERMGEVERAAPPPGDTVLENVQLSFASVPAPVHVIEASGGRSAL